MISALPPTQNSRKKPNYDPYMHAFHHAFAPELEAAIARYRAIKRARILDMPCGDGFYTALFAKHMHSGELVAADLSETYLEAAKKTTSQESSRGPSMRLVKASAYELPFDDESFDMVWCAQSMISLKDPVAALVEMRRVLKPRGEVAVLETDEFHHVLLPWPVGLEVSIQGAIRNASVKRYGSSSKLFQSRKLRSMILEAGLTPTRKHTLVADRQAPFDSTTRDFLSEHFEFLRKNVRPELSVADKELFDRVTAKEGDESLLVRVDSELTCLATIFHAKR